MNNWIVRRDSADFPARDVKMIVEWASAGHLSGSDLVRDPDGEWRHAYSLPELRTYFRRPSLLTIDVSSLTAYESRALAVKFLILSTALIVIPSAVAYCLAWIWPASDAADAVVTASYLLSAFGGLGLIAAIYVLSSRALNSLLERADRVRVTLFENPIVIQLTTVVGWGTAAVMIAITGFWIVQMFTAPFTRTSAAGYRSEVAALYGASALIFEGPIRIDERAGGNVRVYVSKAAYEAIPFPDRPQLLEELSKPWCDSVGESFPAVAIYDIKNGERLGGFSCTWYSIRQSWHRTSQ